MAEETMMKVVVIGRETIKPSSWTPSHLKIHRLSFLDQHSPAIYGRVIYFYTQQNDVAFGSERRSQHLKKSLSESLARFYPMAGHISNNTVFESSYFPQMDLSNFKLPPMEMNKLECVAKRFGFDKSKVVDLKAKAISCEQVPQLWRPLSRNA
ncbi:Transferase [Parasponia andersonii]|uniref:Transferase n=1 Tax=Parasponia andersonii TaxID=3476 RepID=A0A2P5B5Q5_PARAD|nr:Transferase [Parasponia andersonii]